MAETVEGFFRKEIMPPMRKRKTREMDERVILS